MVSQKKQRELDPEFLVLAYCSGYFPMAESRKGPISWYSPDPRAIIPIDGLRIARSLRQTIRRNVFQVRLNTAFADVIRACAEREETWISDEIITAYGRLHATGWAHSVEAWQGGELVGGLYGVAIGGAFFGESMFSRVPDASKVALVSLVERLRERDFRLLDTQFMSEHVKHFGAVEIPRSEYMRLLSEAIGVPAAFVDPA